MGIEWNHQRVSRRARPVVSDPNRDRRKTCIRRPVDPLRDSPTHRTREWSEEDRDSSLMLDSRQKADASLQQRIAQVFG